MIRFDRRRLLYVIGTITAVMWYTAMVVFGRRAGIIPPADKLVEFNPLSFLLMIGIVGIVIWLSRLLIRRCVVEALTSWWSPTISAPEAGLNWDDVYGLVAFDKNPDPLGVIPKIRWRHWWRTLALKQIPSHFVIGFAALVVIETTTNARCTSQIPADCIRAENFIAGIDISPAILVFFLGCATIFFAFRRIRAKVLADSRQQWIIHARSLVSEVLALTDTHREARVKWFAGDASKIWKELNSKRLELELMLNPSEKDHRLLLYLVQKFVSWRTPKPEVQDALNVELSIASEVKLGARGSNLNHRMGCYIEPEGQGGIRVLHSAFVPCESLKREWEKVKLTR